jgi:hypothetical protein
MYVYFTRTDHERQNAIDGSRSSERRGEHLHHALVPIYALLSTRED